jgi:hypothetical protein
VVRGAEVRRGGARLRNELVGALPARGGLHAARPIPNTWYKLRVVASGDNHKVYINDQQVINIYNSRFSDITGYVGLRVSGFSAAFKNVTIE